MNRIIRTLVITGPLAAAALTMAPGAASAETPAPHPGPVIVLPAEPVDPGPQDIANPEPEPQPDPGPQVPDDKAPVPPKDDEPEVPDHNDEITDVPDCTHGCNEDPTPDFPLDSGCFEGCDLPEEPQDGAPGKNAGAPQVPQEETEIAVPTRVDAGLDSPSTPLDQDGFNLTFVLIGGALVTATGAAYAARARSRQGA